MLYNVKESLIDNQGYQYICGMLEEPKLNERGLWHGIKAFDILNNHKRQTATISKFEWINGVPSNFETVRKIQQEIIDTAEIEQVLRSVGIIIAE